MDVMTMLYDTYLKEEFSGVLVSLGSVLLVTAESYPNVAARKRRLLQFENEGELRSVCNA